MRDKFPLNQKLTLTGFVHGSPGDLTVYSKGRKGRESEQRKFGHGGLDLLLEVLLQLSLSIVELNFP